MTITPKPDARGAGGALIPSAPGTVDRAASGHHPKCECDLCFAAQCEMVAEAYRQIREGTITPMPWWHQAERIAREMAE